MLDIPTTLMALSKGLETLKIMREIDKDFDAAAYKAKIAELMGSVADAKIALIDANEQISETWSNVSQRRKSN